MKLLLEFEVFKYLHDNKVWICVSGTERYFLGIFGLTYWLNSINAEQIIAAADASFKQLGILWALKF